MTRKITIRIEEKKYQRYLAQAAHEVRSFSNFADYSMQRRCETNTPQRKKTGQGSIHDLDVKNIRDDNKIESVPDVSTRNGRKNEVEEVTE